MAKVSAAARTHPLAGRKVANKAVKITPAEPAARLSLRAGEDALASLSRALGVKLPTTPKNSAASKSGGRAAPPVVVVTWRRSGARRPTTPSS